MIVVYILILNKERVENKINVFRKLTWITQRLLEGNFARLAWLHWPLQA